MVKKLNGQGVLYSDDEFKMFLKVEDGYLIPTAVRKITIKQYDEIKKREGGFFLEGTERYLVDEDLDEIKSRLVAGESRPAILASMNITETTFANFLHKHLGTKGINEARYKARREAENKQN